MGVELVEKVGLAENEPLLLILPFSKSTFRLSGTFLKTFPRFSLISSRPK